MEFQAPDMDIWALLPGTLVAITALVVLLDGVFRPEPTTARTVWLSSIGLAAAAVATVLATIAGPSISFAGMLLADRVAAVLNLVFLAATVVGILLAADHLQVGPTELAEAAALLCLSCLGMMLMAGSGNLVMLFVGLETMSIALYILSGIAGGREPGSNEAALKYLLLGAFATGFLVYGMAFVFGATGSLDLRVLHDLALHRATIPGFLNVGLALLIIGLGFKVALVPFHMWAPDVYEGAPTPITAFMSVGAKVAGFAALIRVLSEAALPVQEVWLPGLWWLAVATMLVGNVIALVQTSIKRLLAYSSIAHAGYLTIGIVAGTRLGVEAVVYYSLAYALMNLGAFAVVLAANGDHDRLQLDDLRGLARRSPLLAGAMALFMFSLAGVPPLSGFIGKWLLFSAAVEANQVGLAVLAVLCSAISAFYYLRVVVYMYMTEPAETHRPLLDTPRTRTALYATIVGTVLLSFPAGLLFVHLSGWAAWQG